MKETAELKRLLEWQEQRWGQDHPKVVASLESLADLLQMQGKYGEAEPLYWQILEKKHKLFGASDLQVADTIYDLACLHELQENWDECEKLYKWTCSIRCKLLPEGNAQVIESLKKVKEVAGRLGHELDISSFQTAGSGSERAFSASKFNWQAYLEQARILVIERDYDSAEKVLDCLSDVADAYEPATKTQAECLHLLGRVQFHQRRLDKSLRSFEKALALYEQISGTSSNKTAECLEDMADLHCKLAEAGEAEFLYKWALQIHEAIATGDKNLTRLRVKLESLKEICSSLAAKNQAPPPAGNAVSPLVKSQSARLDVFEELQELIREPQEADSNESGAGEMQAGKEDAGDIEEVLDLQDHVAAFLWARWVNSGKAALERGDLLEAEMMLSRGLEKANEFGYQDSRLWETLCEMAALHMAQSKYVKAESLLSKAQQYCEKTLGPMHPTNAVYWEKLGRMYESQGDNTQAVRCFDKLVTILVKANRPLVEYGVFLKKLERLHEKAPASFFE